MNHRSYAAACALLCAAMAIFPVRAVEPVASVPQLELSRYAGQWYEIARLPQRRQQDCRMDVTTHYSLLSAGRIGVRNTCRTGAGKTQAREGVARTVEGHPGRWQVRFAPEWLTWVPFAWADYWVIALDPNYQWAMVGEPGREHLWILSRAPTMERDRFDALKAQAETMGYDLAPLIVSAPVH